MAPRISWLFLLLGAGCTATSTTSSSSSSSSTGGAEPGTDGGGDPVSTPTCTDATSFETDPKNCGRCGRACDDGACNAGLCAPRVEATGAVLPSSVAEEIAVVDGHLFARLSAQANPATHPIVRFDGGKLVTVFADSRLGCGSQKIECMVSDGKTLFVETSAGNATTGEAVVIKRFSGDGKSLTDILVPDDGYAFPQMAAESGRVLLRGVTGPAALFSEDGKVERLPPLRYSEWPILSKDQVLFSNIHAIERVSVGSGAVVVGKVDYTTSSRINAIAANDRFVYALSESGQTSLPTDSRFPRTGSDAPPERTEVISAEAVERLNAASLKAPGATARSIEERAIMVEDRFYFTLRVMTVDQSKQRRVIVEWSEGRGFRPVAAIEPWPGESGTRLVVGNHRLYWLEQPALTTVDRPAWRILSVPL